MYGPTVNNVQYTFFIEIAATGDILVIGGMPFPTDISDHDVIVCFSTQAMADDYVQRHVQDGQCFAGQWQVVTYPNDAVGRVKVVASGATHLLAVTQVHPFVSLAVLAAGV